MRILEKNCSIFGSTGWKRWNPRKVAALKYMVEPTDIHQLRRFLGMVNQSGKYILNLAEFTHPLRELLSKKNAWVWAPPQQTAFEMVKEKLSSAPALAIFDTMLETTLSTVHHRIAWAQS